MKEVITTLQYKDDYFYFLNTESRIKAGIKNYNKHSHTFYEFVYIAEGEIEYFVENRKYALKKGDVLLVKPGQIHFGHKLVKSPCIRFCLGFVPQALENGELAASIFDKGEHLSVGANSVFSTLIYLTKQKLQLSENQASKFIKNMMDAMIISLEDYSAGFSTSEQESSTLIEKTIKFINGNLSKINCVEDISSAMFFSKSHLGHLFKSEMNMGIMDYVRMKKVILANKLITDGKNPTDVYLECGFSNYPSFYRAYLSFFGVSPKKSKNI